MNVCRFHLNIARISSVAGEHASRQVAERSVRSIGNMVIVSSRTRQTCIHLGDVLLLWLPGALPLEVELSEDLRKNAAVCQMPWLAPLGQFLGQLKGQKCLDQQGDFHCLYSWAVIIIGYSRAPNQDPHSTLDFSPAPLGVRCESDQTSTLHMVSKLFFLMVSIFHWVLLFYEGRWWDRRVGTVVLTYIWCCI